MKRALNLLRAAVHYRKDAFNEGLRANGFAVVDGLRDPGPGDVLVIWNRYGRSDDEAARFEAAGATVLVAENGYLGKAWQGSDWYALARGHHLGAGEWHHGGPERWAAVGVECAPWRDSGKHSKDILVLGQRGIGERGIASPFEWAERAAMRLPNSRIRQHPGTAPPRVALVDDLFTVGAVATWSSGAALQALLMGTPVWFNMPQWIGGPAATPLGQWQRGALPLRDDVARLGMFERLAWAMWTLDEVRSGEAIAMVLA
jgi:hypothetical protein